MEPQIAALAALRASSAQLAAIENAFRKCAAARNMDQYEVWDEEFHRTIAAARRQHRAAVDLSRR